MNLTLPNFDNLFNFTNTNKEDKSKKEVSDAQLMSFLGVTNADLNGNLDLGSDLTPTTSNPFVGGNSYSSPDQFVPQSSQLRAVDLPMLSSKSKANDMAFMDIVYNGKEGILSAANGKSVNKEGLGVVTSPKGQRGSGYHKGTDTVKTSGDKNSVYAPLDIEITNITYQEGGAGHYIEGLATLPNGKKGKIQMMHFSSSPKDLGLKKGMKIAAGTLVGYEGNTGRSTGKHLDTRIQVDGQWLDIQKMNWTAIAKNLATA